MSERTNQKDSIVKREIYSRTLLLVLAVLLLAGCLVKDDQSSDKTTNEEPQLSYVVPSFVFQILTEQCQTPQVALFDDVPYIRFNENLALEVIPMIDGRIDYFIHDSSASELGSDISWGDEASAIQEGFITSWRAVALAPNGVIIEYGPREEEIITIGGEDITVQPRTSVAAFICIEQPTEKVELIAIG